MESRKRAIVKAVIWTLLGMLVMALVGLVFTGSLAAGGAMALVNAGLGFATYLLYETVWARIAWGRE